MSWLALLTAGGGLLACLVAYWLLVTTEGTYLGAKVVALTYNWIADRYDAMKEFDPRLEAMCLSRPFLSVLPDRPASLVLDVATGTGRVPMLLLETATFNGRIIGLDYARRMLSRAASKAAGYPDRLTLIWQNAMQLPFPDASFDLVTCMEALEFMPKPQQVMVEMVRVARPGGYVFTSRRRGWETRVMPGKSWSKQEFRAMLISLGLRNVQVRSWQQDYDLVWGKKPAAPSSIRGRPAQQSRGATWVEELLCCPVCGKQALRRDAASLFCSTCSSRYSIAADGIVELAGTRIPTQWRRYPTTGISQIE